MPCHYRCPVTVFVSRTSRASASQPRHDCCLQSSIVRWEAPPVCATAPIPARAAAPLYPAESPSSPRLCTPPCPLLYPSFTHLAANRASRGFNIGKAAPTGVDGRTCAPMASWCLSAVVPSPESRAPWSRDHVAPRCHSHVTLWSCDPEVPWTDGPAALRSHGPVASGPAGASPFRSAGVHGIHG